MLCTVGGAVYSVCGAVYSEWCCVQRVLLFTVSGAVYSVWCWVQ